jgi:uncharacterized protein (DUF2147 family)
MDVARRAQRDGVRPMSAAMRLRWRTVAIGSATLFAVVATVGAALAQAPAPAAKSAAAPKGAEIASFDVLKGNWVRPDGGYVISIKSVGPDGKLEATYFNPNPLPFAKAQAAWEGMTLRASFELRAGGYDGSTYELAYDRASDRLKGIYYQAVAKQKFDVYFARK